MLDAIHSSKANPRRPLAEALLESLEGRALEKEKHILKAPLLTIRSCLIMGAESGLSAP